ncbi:MAG: N-acetylmuramoyl-L-alanine amidase [Rhodobacteraceae bacterium]|nr:N-acetylmuramoyl-L-alanine amidase [Paracoccaceae bacterium]
MRPIPHPSPNFGDRRDGARPDLIVLHYTGMASAAAALALLCDPVAEVSSHYVINTDGTVLALVAEEKRAWHAGAGSWRGRGDVNSHSLGIELVNTALHPFPEPQMAALEALLAGMMGRWGIRPEGVIAHSDLAPTRKSDPGARFDWLRLALAGLSVWPAPGQGDPAGFAADARAFGYPAGIDDAVLLRAFRLRFRPWAAGPLDAQDAGAAADLARRFGIDRTGANA